MDFVTVILINNKTNISTLLLEKGLAQLKMKNEKNSKFFKELLEALNKAFKANLGVFSSDSAPPSIVFTNFSKLPEREQDLKA